MPRQDIINQRLENHSDRLTMLNKAIDNGFEKAMTAIAEQRKQFDAEMKELREFQREQNTAIREASAAMLRASERMEQTAERIEAQTADNAERLTAIDIKLDRILDAIARNAAVAEQNAVTAQTQAQTVQNLAGMVERLLERN